MAWAVAVGSGVDVGATVAEGCKVGVGSGEEVGASGVLAAVGSPLPQAMIVKARSTPSTDTR